jgi:hypothetical protein
MRMRCLPVRPAVGSRIVADHEGLPRLYGKQIARQLTEPRFRLHRAVLEGQDKRVDVRLQVVLCEVPANVPPSIGIREDARTSVPGSTM